MISQERKDELYEQMIEWICEHSEDEEELYNTFHNHLGMTDEEMRENDIEHPVDFQDGYGDGLCGAAVHGDALLFHRHHPCEH